MTKKKNSQLQPFKSGFDSRRNIAGRPKKLVSILTADGYSLSQIIDTISVLLALSIDELKAISDNKSGEYTSLERIISAALIRDHRYGRLDAVNILLDRAFGKSVNKVQELSPEIPLFCNCGKVHHG